VAQLYSRALGFLFVASYDSQETTFYLQRVYIYIYIYIHSANWCEDLVVWLGEGDSLVPFRSYLGYEPGGESGNNTCI
jgi:hypothetical protein